ncbi:hypothetical protein AB0M57_14145 [Streptomyces sp. NPDC051597]|uniref:hypothetical protein n=1 Tax=Streptomyces sp. NPDC051597 TaxID=3155049 RepID=UPI00343976B8
MRRNRAAEAKGAAAGNIDAVVSVDSTVVRKAPPSRCERATQNYPLVVAKWGAQAKGQSGEGAASPTASAYLDPQPRITRRGRRRTR